MPGLHAHLWHGLWTPKGTPKEVIAKLNSAVVDALSSTDVQSRLADLGQTLFSAEQRTPEALAAYHRAETEKWWPIIEAAGIKAV